MTFELLDYKGRDIFMFLNDLQRLLSFGEHLSSNVTEKDIKEKECELTVELPDAVRKLYLHVSPKDSMFTTCRMIPLEELTLRKAEDEQQYYQVIPIFIGGKRAFGPAISAEQKYGVENPYWTWDGEEFGLVLKANFPKKNLDKPIKIVRGTSGQSISVCILNILGTQVIQSLKSLVGVQDLYGEKHKRSSQVTKSLWDVYDWFIGFAEGAQELKIDKKSGLILGLNLPSDVDCLYDGYDVIFGADTDKPLEQLIQETGAPLEWIKSQSRNVTPAEIWEPEPEERLLIPISPILEYIRDFTGLAGRCTPKEKIEQAEQKLGCQLPISLKEFYMHLPQSLFTSYDTIWSISKLRRMKDGKIKFLEENQGSFYGAVQPGSSLMYRQWEREWEAAGVLDGYLAVEFMDSISEDESIGLVMEECQHIKEEQLTQDPLKQYLSELAGISSKIAIGNSRQLYDVCEGQGIAVYDRDSESLYIYAKGYDVLEKLLKMLGLT